MTTHVKNASVKYYTFESKCELTGDYCSFSGQNIGCMDCRQCNVPIVMAIKELSGQGGAK